MEKNTYSSCAPRGKGKAVAINVGRASVTALLVLAVICATRPGSMRVAASQSGYTISSLSAGASPSAVKVGDLDGDGSNDIAVVNLQGNLQLFFNNGNASFARVSMDGLWPPTSNTLDVDIGDLNGDGRNDLAVAFSTQRGAVSVLLNQGNRSFSAPVNYDVCSGSKSVAIGDLDQDGDNDLADISQCSRAGILRNNAQGGFALSGTYGNGNDSKSIALGDLNRDGAKDIVYVNNGVGVHGSITVLLNNGNGTFGAPLWNYAGDLPDDVTIGDFDGDSTADVAIANSYYSQIIMLFGSGAGDFNGYSELTGADTPTSIASADLNGDGRLDFAVTSWSTSRLSIFLNQGNYNFVVSGTFNVGQSPVGLAIGKLDGDAIPDLVTVNQGSGSLTVFLSVVGTPPPPPPPPITLTASTRMTSKNKFVDLRWSGAPGSSVTVYRNDSSLAVVPNNGRYTDQFSRHARGTFRYKICIGSGQCSNEAAITL